MHLGGIPALLDIFVAVLVLVRVFALVDRTVDRWLAQLHPLRRKGGRSSGLLLSPRGASALQTRSYFVAHSTGRTSELTQKEK